MKTYLKTLFRMFKKHILRFLSLVFMVLISIGFISGIGSSQDKINYSMSDYYKAQTVSDFIIKSKSDYGFTEEDIGKVKSLFEGAEVNTGASLDIHTGENRSLRLYFLDFDNWTVNVPTLTEGERPSDKTQAYAEIADNVIKGYSVGEEAEIDLSEFGIPVSFKVTVSGIVQSPLTFARDGEPSYNNPEDMEVPDVTTGTADMDCLENILYISKELMPFVPVGDIYLAVKNRNTFKAFSNSYKSLIKDGEEKIYGALDNVRVITLEDNYSFKSLYGYGEKVANIGYVIMVAFLLVTALVVLSTMTRLIDEERSQIACLKTLGYSPISIVSKYLLFALIATGIGGFGAYFVGLGITRLLYFVFNYSFAMPPISLHVALVFYVITVTVIVLGTLIATAVSGFAMTHERPAELLRPKPPKSGKKVIIERIPFIWNSLSFKYKSTVRNVLRYKSRFIMTVVAVAISTALVLAGLALLDLCLFHDFGSAAIMGIAVVIMIFAGLLTVLVIYTLTNINISERNREIATLMVLGYQNGEVSGYIFREIFINSIIGILLGYPLSCLLNLLVFYTMGIGTLGGITWFWWLVTPVLVLAFTGFVALILRRKIVKVNMNESLKAIE